VESNNYRADGQQGCNRLFANMGIGRFSVHLFFLKMQSVNMENVPNHKFNIVKEIYNIAYYE